MIMENCYVVHTLEPQRIDQNPLEPKENPIEPNITQQNLTKSIRTHYNPS